MSGEIELIKSHIRDNIQLLIDDNKLEQAMSLIDEYVKIDSQDTEIYSMKAIIFIMQGKTDKAEEVLKQGLAIDKENFDLNYNLGYLYEQEEKFNEAVGHYRKAVENCIDEKMKVNLTDIIEKILSEHNITSIGDKKRIVFFVKQGMDSFLGDVIEGLSSEYETKKIVVTEYDQVDEGMKWADICWFEWCDELTGYGSRLPLANEKKIICRLHSYEAFTDYPSDVDWNKLDKVIFVAEHIRKFVVEKFNLDKDKTIVIPNGIKLEKLNFKQREQGYNIAYVGYINYKKGPMLLLQTFKAMYDKNSKYKLFIAGEFQDNRDVLYFKQMIKEFGIEKNVFYQGWQNNLDNWLEDKNYILCTSVLESQNMSVMQAMAKGIKPIIHNFVGAKNIYKDEYLWNTINEAVKMITSSKYNSMQYRQFIEESYSLDKQMKIVEKILNNVLKQNKNEPKNKCLSYDKGYHNEEEKLALLIREFKTNSDNISNTENLFDYLIDVGDEQGFMEYLSEWFIRSKYDLTSRFNYYYSNMYRRFNSYNRFKYMNTKTYKEMERIGGQLLKRYYVKKSDTQKIKSNNNEKKKVLFILNGLDKNQSVTQFFVNCLRVRNNIDFKYSVMSLLNETEFNNSRESIEFFNDLEVDLFLPSSDIIEDKIKEFYKYFSENEFDYIVYQSCYFAPINSLLMPLLKSINSKIGRVVFQQEEKYFDDKIDFLVYYIEKDVAVSHRCIFRDVWPIDTEVVDKNLNIRDLFTIHTNKKVIISIGRAIKYKNNQVWSYVKNVLKKSEDICFVFFGLTYNDIASYIEYKDLDNRVFFGGYNKEAIAYLKSADLYLNSFPVGGGLSLIEAYYAELPIISYAAGDVFSTVITALYNNSENIFPVNGNESELIDFTIKNVNDGNFIKYIQENKKVDFENLRCNNFFCNFEGFLKNLK